MKFQKTTIILVFLALGLGAFVYFSERKTNQERENIESTDQINKKPIFNWLEKDIQNLTIETQGKTLKFERTDPKNQPWEMTEPEKITASEPAISFLVNLLIESKINQSFVISKDRLADYGLEPPLARILIKLKNQQEHQVILGKSNFDNTLIYAQVDPENESANNPEIVLISKSFQYAVERDFDEWKQQQEEQKPNQEDSSPKEQ
jgi:hypothetical protein